MYWCLAVPDRIHKHLLTVRQDLQKLLTTQNIRRITQGLFLLLFLFLFIQTESKGNDELGYPVRLFLDFDPLISISTMLAAHALPVAFLLSLITVVATVLSDRRKATGRA